MSGTISLLGLWAANKGLFDFLKIPTALNKQVLVDNLLMQCAEFEILYPDAEFMRDAIGSWSAAEFDKWDELEKTLHYDYDPISNYDRREEWTDESEGISNSSAKGSTSGSGTTVSTNKQAGYNSENLVISGGSDGSAADSAETSNETASSGKNSSKRVGTVKGNIGVTTSQQMIEEQRKIVNFCVYDVIIDSFQRRFCLLVY